MKPCYICEKPCLNHQAVLCPRCTRLRGSLVAKGPRTEALRRAWNRNLGAFLCHYSGAVLTAEPCNPWSIVFHCQTPGNCSDVVVCARLIHQFKSNLTELEFRQLVVQLSERFTGVRERIAAFMPTHWGMDVKPFRRA